jgi:Peptidase C13 family
MPARSLCTLVTLWFALATPVPAQPQISPQDIANAQAGMSWEQGHDAAWYLAQHRKLAAAIGALKPQRPGTVDAYLVVIGLDADPVFAREAAETAKVLARRYDATGRTVLLSAGSEATPDGSPPHLAASLAAIAQKMDRSEDALILYATAHGAPGIGVVYKDSDKGYGMVAPKRLGGLLDQLGIVRRMLLISACYSGQFVGLATPESVVVTAADDDRTSFGCAPANDWTFFGDALINHAFRKPQPFAAATDEAFKLISDWEYKEGLTSSKPRLFMGEKAKSWLATLEARIPPGETAKVGRPSIEGDGAVPAGR